MKKLPHVVAGLCLLAIFLYGAYYQASKTLLHLSAVLALVWLGFNLVNRKKIELDSHSLIFVTLLITSAVIIYIEHNIYPNKISKWAYKDFFYPAIVAALVIAVLPDMQSMKKMFQVTVLLSLICMVGSAYYQTYQFGFNYRVEGEVGLSIIFATNLAMLSVVAFIIAYDWRGEKNSTIFAVSVGLMGLSAVALSGSRGPMLALCVCGIVMAAIYAIYLRRYKEIIILSLVMLGLTSAIISYTKIGERLREGVMQYQENPENKTSSHGVRVEMWRGAYMALSENPLTGTGFGLHREYFKEKLAVNSEYIEPAAVQYVHLHNDYVNALAWFGLPVGAAFLLFIFWQLYVFSSKLKDGFYMQSGFAITLVFMVCGLTNSPMSRASSFTLLIILTALCLASLPRKNAMDKIVS